MTACSMTRSKIKVISPKSQKFGHFQRLSPPLYNGGWQMTMDSYIRGQYLNLIGAGFLVLLFASRDSKIGSK